MNEEKTSVYGKRPLWQWVVLYIVIGGVLYGLVYYFFFANTGGYTYNTPASPTSNTTYGTQSQTPQNTTAPVPSQTTPPAPSPAPVASTSPQSVSVAISNFVFNPSQISVKVGTKVTWTNKDATAHTVTSNNGAFDSGTINQGSTFSFVFKTPGTYSYHCNIHPSMTATVVVTQ